MWGYLVIATWFAGLVGFVALETKHGGVESAGKVSVFVMVLTGFGAVLLTDWIVFPVAAIAIALNFVPKSPETIRAEIVDREREELNFEREYRREALREAKEDHSLGLLSDEDYDQQVAAITGRPVD